MEISRRNFLLKIGLGIISVLFIITYLKQAGINSTRIRRYINKFLPSPSNISIINELRSELDYLEFTNETGFQFLSEYRKFYQDQFQDHITAHISMGFNTDEIRFPLPDRFCKLFILSTDFIQQGCLKNKVKYKMIYSPHDHICYNPLATRTKLMFGRENIYEKEW